jgi:protein tyrosine phosphatase (PTP) superfamily phosphohydrolase (DUF442 family)
LTASRLLFPIALALQVALSFATRLAHGSDGAAYSPQIPAPAIAAETPLPQRQAARIPNLVEITPKLFTSAQPDAKALSSLAEQGFEAVVYLAPFSSWNAIAGEPDILARQGIAFVHVPVNFDQPTSKDYEALASALRDLSGRKTLVHCQVNMRASSMVFLYRVIEGKEDPNKAYESVARIWAPNDTWKRFMRDVLRSRGIAFEAY